MYTRLAMLNLERILMNGSALDASLHGLAFATARAHVEGGWHYPSDTLFRVRFGDLSAYFFTNAFIGLNNPRERIGFAPVSAAGY